ncbi:glycosyltransferase [Rhizobiaceae bacterium BDR2-2]|uniref:Glycosyltransferase n=1 Tax=Ectorhizobium quercum TaxID=2965071 RepID=A0AAE3N205_9HYPH|nr:glycosyltransferase [Ectorhizobium quercum]MCX8996220.1 glycosyltransferase [Ectorhizobium quercum]MCX8998741.1 glycosyltransferase [Ectorhizobium quercum]
MHSAVEDVGVVLIGRNEGARLTACMASLGPLASRSVYVDSGSTDGSVEAARRMGLTVVLLDAGTPFTAARARNAGFAELMRTAPALDFVQFVDGDCRIAAGWIEKARAFLLNRDDAAIVCGRRRERFPDASIYNAICDREWDTPVGEAIACGGDCLVRSSAFRAVGGYAPDLIAGEEPEMCLRLREAGWSIWRIDAEMTLHDAALTHFFQWWRRSVRAGHAYAEVAARHRTSPKRIWSQNVRRAVLWGGLLPLLAVSGSLAIHPAFLALLAAYPLQIARLAVRSDLPRPDNWRHSFFMVIGKFAEMQGVCAYYLNRLCNRRQTLIEYK